MSNIALIWFKNDLRLIDNEAIQWATENELIILPYFHYQAKEQDNAIGGATKWWLHQALQDLQTEIERYGGQLLLGSPHHTTEQALTEVIEKHKIRTILWNRNYEPSTIKRDSLLKKNFREMGLQVKSFNSNLLFDPTVVKNKSKTPFKVFTPFWKTLRDLELQPLPEINLNQISWASLPSTTCDLRHYELLPRIPWDQGFSKAWNPTRKGALEKLSNFLPAQAIAYPENRDRPDLEGTSKLSPYLHFGQIGPRELLHHLRSHSNSEIETGVTRQLFWREFGHHLLYHFNWTPTQPLYEKYAQFPWEENKQYQNAWKRGRTGYPIIDAAMRELWTTGWMHNRARMIASSFLVKHLLQPWQIGAEWFWDTLVDANLANNTLGWQWVAGCGADSAPYFRVFNPITQGKKFDKTGDYVKKWCPELKDLPLKYLHNPWECSPIELASAGVTLGKNYPHPIISHTEGRQKALDAFATWKEMLKI